MSAEQIAPPEGFADVQAAIVDACKRLDAAGILPMSAGNVSVRLSPVDGRELIAITPSQVPYRVLRPEQVVAIDLEGNLVIGEGHASSERKVHLAAYKARPDAGAAIHSHSPYASALAVAGLDIPALIDEQVVGLGRVVKVCDYAMSATDDLAKNAIEALGDRQAVLLRNHGAFGVGRDLDEACNVVELVERVATIYVLARQAGEVHPLPEGVVAIEEKFFRIGHGRPADG
jgi:L-fuculose-phosphate aldolase